MSEGRDRALELSLLSRVYIPESLEQLIRALNLHSCSLAGVPGGHCAGRFQAALAVRENDQSEYLANLLDMAYFGAALVWDLCSLEASAPDAGLALRRRSSKAPALGWSGSPRASKELAF